MTHEKKFKQRVRALAEAENLSYMEAHRRLSQAMFYRAQLILTDSDGYETDRRLVNLSSFPRTGELVRLHDGRTVEVWHPILKASMNPSVVEVEDCRLPSVLASLTETDQRPTVREVVGDVHAPPVYTQIFPETHPGGVWRHLTRALTAGDGIDIELPDPMGPSMVGHHVYSGPSGLYVKREMLDREYWPRRRYRLPPFPTAA